VSKRRPPEEVAREWFKLEKEIEEAKEYCKKVMEIYERLKGGM